ncbi:Sperm-associated antigen 1, related [Eimeria acervulina]|uniref:Sperm-associated antigen 1, related n=1 Tax=Eimeria acervulina TaxID=5801 RepID=U6GE31_EIMAC|nr:Sperm-associated antigen 1, related [Eimeria acervulina]CDI76839.1 Sperm-associated antigen 1, related [Eimeria acervulina]
MSLTEGITPGPSPPLPVGPPGGAGMGEEGTEGAPGGPPGAPSGAPRDEDTCSDASSMSADELLTPEEHLKAAIDLKDEGNGLFKGGQYEEALAKYKAGVKHLKGATASEAIAVSVQLSSNSCMCCLKLQRWQQAIAAANEVLSKEPQNPKALYRRALAKSSLGELSDAKDDLMAVLAVDKTNAEARKEFMRVREKIQAAKAEDKKLGVLSVSLSLSCGEPEESFDTWLEKKTEAEEKEREEKQKGQAKVDSPQGGLQRRKSKGDSSRSSSSSSSSSSSVMEIDEEDAAIINETKKMDVSPWARTRFAERLQEASANCGDATNASPEALLEVCRKATEAFKSGGLKDDKGMQELLKGCFTTTIETKSVGDVTGDAHLAVVRGSRRVFFDLKCSIQLNICCSCSKGPLGEAAAESGSLGNYESQGTLNLPDVSSADGSGMSWLDGSSLSFTKPPPNHFKPMVDEAVQKYKESLVDKIQAFLDDCKALP